MSGGVFVLTGAELVEMHEQPYDSEELLQMLLAKYPNLLAGGDQLAGSPRSWLLVKRETGVPDREGGGSRWSLDHLFIDQDCLYPKINPRMKSCSRATQTGDRGEPARGARSLGMLRLGIGLALSISVLALATARPIGATPPTLSAALREIPVVGQEGPGFKLVFMLTADGNPVTKIPSGTYTLVVDDQSKILNFHLIGPGGADVRAIQPVGTRVTTGVESKGKVVFRVRLTRGLYTYFSDPHEATIRKTFRVV